MTDDKPATAAAESTLDAGETAPSEAVENAEETKATTETKATAETKATTETKATAETKATTETKPAKPHRNVKQRDQVAPARPTKTVESEPEERGRDGWRRVGAVAVVLVAAFAVVVLWARPAHEPAPPLAQRGSSVPPSAVTVLNPTDIAYLQLMISLDTSAMQLFDLIVAGGDPVLAPIGRSAAEGHRMELAALRKALADGGAIEDSSIHAGHDLPGMVIDADMAAIRAMPAAQQPAKALEVLREHLTGTTALCGSEAKNGADPATKAAAEQVLAAHGKLLAQLPAM